MRSWIIQTRKCKFLAQKKKQIEFVHEQLTKQMALREWRQALFASFVLNKIAMPYCTTVLLKTAFRALKRVTT